MHCQPVKADLLLCYGSFGAFARCILSQSLRAFCILYRSMSKALHAVESLTAKSAHGVKDTAIGVKNKAVGAKDKVKDKAMEIRSPVRRSLKGSDAELEGFLYRETSVQGLSTHITWPCNIYVKACSKPFSTLLVLSSILIISAPLTASLSDWTSLGR